MPEYQRDAYGNLTDIPRLPETGAIGLDEFLRIISHIDEIHLLRWIDEGNKAAERYGYELAKWEAKNAR